MASATLKEWKLDTLEAYEVAKRLGDKIILVSVSTGSTLSTWLVNEIKDTTSISLIGHWALVYKSLNLSQEKRSMNGYHTMSNKTFTGQTISI